MTVYGTINAGAVPNNDDIWLEVGISRLVGNAVGTIVKTTKASCWRANAAVASDGSSWNGGGTGAGWSPFKLVYHAVLAAARHGRIHRCAGARRQGVTTYYIDPKIELTYVFQRRIP